MWVRIVLKGMLLFAPFLAIMGTVWVVDPYDLFRTEGVIPKAEKVENLRHAGRTMAFSNLMWKVNDYPRVRSPYVLLGDSRLSRMDMDLVASVSGHAYYSFGVPGGNFRTVFDLFAFADGLVDLRSVVVQTSFRSASTHHDWDLFNEPLLLANEPLLYLTNWRVLEATTLTLAKRLAPQWVRPEELPEDQWDRVLGMEEENAYKFELDTNVFIGLQAIADRCEAIGAELVLVEYPVHPETHAIYDAQGLSRTRAEYLQRIARIAPLIDLNHVPEITQDNTLWRDPLHLTEEGQDMVVGLVWGRDLKMDPR